MITISDGKVTSRASGLPGPNCAYVQKIDFLNGRRVNGIVRANGGEIILTLKSNPNYRNFERGDYLDYEDGNQNNNRSFRVSSCVGPWKYKLQEI